MPRLLLITTLGILILAGCAPQNQGSDTGKSPNLAPQEQVLTTNKISQPPQMDTLSSKDSKIFIATNDGVIPEQRGVAVDDFKRTLESTKLTLHCDLGGMNSGQVLVQLYSGGKAIEDDTIEVNKGKASGTLKFKTPSLSDVERQTGNAMVSYDLKVTDGKNEYHKPFTLNIFDSKHPAFVELTGDECLIYHDPERASGCIQNRTRSIQELDFADQVTISRETDVQLSAGLSIPISVVTLSVGGQITKINADQTSKGSNIHYVSCIECSAVIFRQVVDDMRKANVYSVQIDGKLNWMGSATLTTKGISYEFTSTPSESQNYSCDLHSKLPVGMTPSCSNF